MIVVLYLFPVSFGNKDLFVPGFLYQNFDSNPTGTLVVEPSAAFGSFVSLEFGRSVEVLAAAFFRAHFNGF